MVPLEPGRTYTVSFYARSRIDRSGMAPTTWSAVFVAGEPDSAQLWDDACMVGP